MMMTQQSNKTSRRWQEYATWLSRFFLSSTSRKWTRNVVIAFYIIVFILLSYSRVYNPLKEDVPLSVSIDQENPTLNLTMLQAINAQRADRIKRDKPDYIGFSRIFIVPTINE